LGAILTQTTMPKKQQRIFADPFAGQNAGQHQIHDCYAVMRTTCQNPPKRNSADVGYENHGAGQNGGTIVDVLGPIPPDEGLSKLNTTLWYIRQLKITGWIFRWEGRPLYADTSKPTKY
jgi:hypothetical protein